MLWEWDDDKIRKIEVSEDIVEFLVENTLQDVIQEETKEVLTLAACIGSRGLNTFILSHITGVTPEEVGPPFNAY